LFTSRNDATTRKHSGASLGGRGLFSASTVMATRQAAKAAALTAFSTTGARFGGRSPSNPGQPLKCDTMLYSDSGLGPRSWFRRKNSHHPAVHGSATGRLTAAQAIAAPRTVRTAVSAFRRRTATRTTGSSRNSGYSFRAPPTPSRTPASHGRPRARASRPVVAAATASVS